MEKKKRNTRSRKERNVLVAAVEKVEKDGFIFLNDTRSQIKDCIEKAIRKGTIKDKSHIEISTIGLVSAAVTKASENRKKRVTRKHLSEGWRKSLRAHNCPPHDCLFRSVVLRKHELSKSNSTFHSLLDIIEGHK